MQEFSGTPSGVGVKGGSKAAVHAIRAFLLSCTAESALLKIDFCNVLNCICRDCIGWRLSRSSGTQVPELLFLDSAYSEASILQFGEFQVLS